MYSKRLLRHALFGAMAMAVARAGTCPTDEWGNTPIQAACTCGSNGATDGCTANKYCYGDPANCEIGPKMYSGCDTSTTKDNQITGDACDCDGTTCVPGKYCWQEGPHGNKCRDSSQPPRQRCSAGFTGTDGNQHTGSSGCPSGFTARGPDDGHEGVGMDFTECCRAMCNTRYPTCPKIAGKTVNPYDGHCYPTDSENCQQETCCKLECKIADHFDPSLCTGTKFVKKWGQCSDSGCTATDCCQEPGMCYLWGQQNGNNCPDGKVPRSKEDGYMCSGDQSPDSANCNAEQCCQEPPGCDGSEDAGPAENACKCESDGQTEICAVGQYCSNDDAPTCTNEKPVKNKPSSECSPSPNTATAPLSNTAAAAKIQKLKDLEAYMRVLFASTKGYYKSDKAMTACKEISKKWKEGDCSSVTSCDSSSSENTACCKQGSDDAPAETCEESEDDWRKSLGVKGPADVEWESCCDACLDTSISSKQSYKDRCTPNEWGFSTGVVVCNKYRKDGAEKSYCGEPVKFINTDNNPHAKSSTDGKLEFKPEGSCDMVATDVDKIVTIFKTSKLTSDSSYQDIYNFYNGLGEADQKFWEKPYEGMGSYLLSAPVIAAAEDPGTLGAETNSYEKASIFIPDLRDKDCNKCARMLNHATLNGILDARGGTAYIHRAETLAGSKILVSGGVSLWGMSIINAAEISGSTTGDVFLYKIINSGTITINNVKGAVIQDVVNTGKIVLTDVVGNGIDISNKKGGSIEFKGSCNVNMNFRKVEAGSTVKFSADMVGKLGIPEADMGNISPPDGVTKEKYTPPAEDPLVGGVDGNGGKDPRGGDVSPSPSSSSEAADDFLPDRENSTRRETMCVLAAAMAVLAFFSHFAC